uniref:Choline dehydrogenase n=1 Tax=Candidatus Kentrum sp. UNK TaxID=2126344 RepID=A0A451AY16_9GAMM|nr:MAG: hypothetical protein BECKUNK1418G_GA0071005_103618 [Candidatus Kentron sp. UNK]VFK70933.1 MAG: hypothetical protein BECKUNK1418H_GA0071006_104319 [Candidatus Kentron sp. UNK]
MQKIFDVVLIGAGPAAVAALAALPKGLSAAIVTGTGAAGGKKMSGIHAKIRATAWERREPPGIARPLPFKESSRGMLCDSAVIGGLANYWGQQFIHYQEDDTWSLDIFSSYEGYLQTCSKVETLFTCSGGQDNKHKVSPLTDTYVTHTPRLLTGTKAEPNAGLVAMRNCFTLLAETHGARLYSAAAVLLKSTGAHVCIHLADGTKLTARRVVLAAGVVGSLRLTMASCAEVQSVRLTDHAPYMFYLLDNHRIVKRVCDDTLEHFNSLSLERVEENRVRLFASFYRMSQAPIGLTLAALGLPPLFPRTCPPKIVDLITPIQVWTAISQMQYQVDRNAPWACLISRPELSGDEELQRFQDWLSTQGFILRRSQTLPGYGFHYHAGEISLDGAHFQNSPDFIRERFQDRVLCIDASILTEIGVRPLTLTAMASAYEAIERMHWNNGEQ